MARALEITHSVISKYYQRKTGLQKGAAKTGAVTLIQRFGGSLNYNPHFHQLFIDGCYELGPEGEPIDFYTAPSPTLAELDKVLNQIIKRFTKYLERQKIIIKDNEESFQLEISEEDTFSKLQASSITYRFATGPSKGKKAMVLKALPDGDHNSKTGLVAKNSGFSLHAGVATKAHERDNLEKICRYIARPAVEEERLSINAIGDVIYKFKKTATCEAVQLRMWPLGQRHDRNQAYTDGTDGAACCLSAPPEGALNPISRSSWAPLKIPKRHRTEEKNRANSSGSRTRNRCEWRCRTEASTSQKKNFLGQAS